MQKSKATSKTHVAQELKQIFGKCVYDNSRQNELEEEITGFLKEYGSYVFDGDEVNVTVRNFLGKKRSEVLLACKLRQEK